MTYNVAYWYAGYQVKKEKPGLSLLDAAALKKELMKTKGAWVHYEIHKDKAIQGEPPKGFEVVQMDADIAEQTYDKLWDLVDQIGKE